MSQIVDIGTLVKFSKALNVLYVEDNPQARESTIDMLGNFFDHLTIAVDGKDGLDKFNEDSYDLIISDINMPKMTGIEMIGEIKKINEDVYIIVLSAHNESGYLVDTKELGANDYLLKPIDIKKFIHILGKLYKALN